MHSTRLAETCRFLLDCSPSIADHWYTTLLRNAPAGEEEARRWRLAQTTRQAILLLCTDPLPNAKIRALGATLARRYSHQPGVIAATVEALLSAVGEVVPAGHNQSLQPRLARFLGQLVAGFTHQASVSTTSKKAAPGYPAPTNGNGVFTPKLRSALQETKAFRTLLEAAPVGIVIVDEAGHIVLANGRAEEMFGYSRKEMLNRKVELLIPARYRGKHTGHRARYLGDLGTRAMGPGLNLIARRKDGAEFPVDVGLGTIKTRHGNLIMSFIMDISAREEAEKQIRLSLQEKDTLLKEIHHRVKNNLQIISSLLDLQGVNSDDARLREMYRESRDRIRSMALVHEQLYGSRRHATVDFDIYLRQLCDHLFRSYNVDPSTTHLSLEVFHVETGIDTAVAVGLIVNELVSNSLKHAFPHDSAQNKISVRLHQSAGDQLALTIADNGVGLAPTADIEQIDSLGLRLVSTLVMQLNGKMQYRQEDGATFEIVFPVTERIVLKESHEHSQDSDR